MTDAPPTELHRGAPLSADVGGTDELRTIAGRFEVLRWLGEGGMGTVYLAQDKQLERRVAVKVLLATEPDALARFKQEFRALSRISHPNLIVLHELLCDEETWLFTMDYVEGRDFLQHVSSLERSMAPTLLELEAQRTGERGASERRAPPRCPVRDEAVLRRVLAQLVDAVRSLHVAGKLHLDLKPSNVLVTSSDQVTVLDFGLARDLAPNAPLWTQRLLGTPAYMAPEHASSGRYEAASDWYGVGVMLYEALTGRLPFEGPVSHVLLSKTSSDPDPPSRLCADVPRELEAVCMALLARDPAARPDGSEILARLGQPAPSARPAAQRAPAAGSEPFVGRTQLLAELERGLAPPRPRVVLLHGPSGIGKTALARRLLERLSARPRTLVLRGACHEREALPFKAFDGLVDALVAHLSKLPPVEAGALLPRHAHTLSRLFPAFASLPGLALSRRIEEEDPVLGRARAFGAFAELFGRLSDQAEVVLFVDDLQFSDRDSTQLLGALLGGAEPVPISLLGTFRSDESEPGELVEALRELARTSPRIALSELAVPPLEADEARELADVLLEVAGAAHEGAAVHIARESQGIPLFVHELTRHAAQCSPGRFRDVSLAEVLSTRIAGLSVAAASLLDVLAVAGGPTPGRVLFRAARLGGGHEAALHTLRVAGLARSRGAPRQDLIDAADQRARSLANGRLSPEVRARIHARLLAAFEAEEPPDDERLLRHAMGAGCEVRALDHAQRAAARAAEMLAFHRASELYRIALDLLARVSPDDAARRGELVERLGTALAASGYCLDAARALLEAAALSPPERTAELERRAADQLLRGGDLVRGSELLRRVLERVGVGYPRSPRGALAALAFERARLFARGLAFEERPPAQIAPEVHALLEALRTSLGVYWLVEPVRGALFATLYLRHALDAGHARHVRRGLETEAAYVALTGGARAEARAGELYAAARKLTERIGTHASRTGNLIAEAGFHAIYGRKQKSNDCVLAALAAARPESAGWEQTYARFHLYQNALYLGGRAGLAEEISEHIEDAERRRDHFSAATLLPTLAMAHLMADGPSLAEEALARMRAHLSPDVFGFLDVQEMVWTALTHLYRGDATAALATYAARAERYVLSGMPRLSTWRLLHHWGTLLAHLGAIEQGGRTEPHLEAAEDRIRRLERERVGWPLPFALSARAAVCEAQGQTAARDRALASAIAKAEELGYRPFVLLFRLVAAEIRGDAAGAATCERGLIELGIAAPERWRRAWAPALGAARGRQ